MMRVSGRGRGHISATFAQSEASAAADWLRLVQGRSWPTRLEKRRRANAANKNDRKNEKKKIRHNTASLLIREVGQCPTFHDPSCFIGQKALWRSRCVRLALKQHFFLLSAFVSWQLWATRTVYRSLAEQRGEAESVMSWHLVSH